MHSPTPSPRQTCLSIDGMTCASCELLLERSLRKLPGVTDADVDHKTGTARVTGDGPLPSSAQLRAVIEKAGYRLAGESGPASGAAASADRKWLEIGGAFLVVFALAWLLRSFDLTGLAPSSADTLTLGGIFLIGLVAGTSSCLAVSGGLLLAVAAAYNQRRGDADAGGMVVPLIQFNIGRLVSYFVFGGLVGLLGKSLTLSPVVTGYLNILVAFVMLWMGVQLLGLVPKTAFPIRPPKALSRRIAALSDNGHPAAPLFLGALTFFLPCGFTQSLQLVALASGSFSVGAMTMLLFALGTLPSLVGISVLSTTASGGFSRLFLRFAGASVLVLSLMNVQSGLALAGWNVPTGHRSVAAGAPAVSAKGVQEISMEVTPYGTYEPDILTVRAGVPVRWIIDGHGVEGCTRILVVPALGISTPLTTGKNVVEFTPPEPGDLAFSCSMGMVRGTMRVI